MLGMNNNSDDDVPYQHNSEASAHGMVLCVDVDFDCAITANVEHELMAWLTEGLLRAHDDLDPDNLWHYVHGVRHDQWEDDRGLRRMNGLQVTLHFSTDFSDGYDWPLFRGGQAKRIEVDAADVMQVFSDAPDCVRMLGVSAVTQTTVVREWVDTIQKDPEGFCRAGLGYRRHLMHTLHSSSSAENPIESEDMSSTFGWPNYPGTRGEGPRGETW
jgi:hypothetical protein